MKKCILGLCILGLTNLICAQNDLAMVTANVDNLTAKSVKTSEINNAKYLYSSNLDAQNLALNIKKLQKIAADYDIKNDVVYSKNKTITYDVVFKDNANIINAVYDYNGIIISSEEYYENVRLPYSLTKALANEYPGWSFAKSNCTIMYSKNGEVKSTYNIKLKKGNKMKLITR
ncbi:hypothetical protein [Winogradskyella bathintestinalis]|uniref:Nicotinate-nucleotide adenylyltransferase n=1 Tax=Winogradskyella bathintestinalis TaxID=3035208 RepID=A0ABT7ZXB4_9FLAO|nr:hypothetical protein [Winogradskyella bathintestinalis]MDN3493619.1 hypothetical protein [Winogradskyella bathintestinalis]